MLVMIQIDRSCFFIDSLIVEINYVKMSDKIDYQICADYLAGQMLKVQTFSIKIISRRTIDCKKYISKQSIPCVDRSKSKGPRILY